MYIRTYLYTQKLSPRFLWVLKFDVKWWVGEHYFRNYPMYVSFQIFGSKLVHVYSIVLNHRTHKLYIKSIQCPCGVLVLRRQIFRRNATGVK